MNPEVKQLWLDALRSGEYPQGSNGLRKKDDTYCCLGVLVSLFIEETKPCSGFIDAPGSDYYELPNGETSYLTHEITEWAGIGVDPLIKDVNGNLQSLALLNDTGTTFKEIANLIEAQF